MKNKVFFWIFVVLAVSLSGCRARIAPVKIPAYDQSLLPGQNALRKITNPYEIPDFTLACLNLTDLRTAIDRSINYLKKGSSQSFFPSSGITHTQALDSLKAFAKLLDSGLTGNRLNAAIQDEFDVYTSVGYDNKGTVLFTGYYTPIFDGSSTRTDRFQYPLYQQPGNLIKSPDGRVFRSSKNGQLTPYPSRAVIERSGMLTGQELIWLADPFEVYIAHVQGSAKIKMPNGKLVTVGYSASNGHEYSSISKELVKDGKITIGQISLSSVINYFRKHKNEVTKYIQRNKRYIFFKEEQGQPRGSLNEPVTAMRTIATDKSIFPRACLTLIATSLPKPVGNEIVNQIYSGFALDQDTGGAIRAAGRCDVYMGEGETAGQLAGQIYQKGRLYYLFLKSSY